VPQSKAALVITGESLWQLSWGGEEDTTSLSLTLSQGAVTHTFYQPSAGWKPETTSDLHKTQKSFVALTEIETN